MVAAAGGGSGARLRPVRAPRPVVLHVPGGHIAGGVASQLEVAVRPVDLGLGGAGGVERGTRGPVNEHVVAVIRGGGISHGS